MAGNGNYNLDAIYEALKSFDNYTAPYEIEVTLELINSKIKNTESTISELKSRTFYQGNDILNNLQSKLKDAKSYVTDSLVPVSRDLYTLKRLLKKRNDLKTTKKKTKVDKPYYDYNDGFYDYLVQYYVEDEPVKDSKIKISELESVELAIVRLIEDIKYKTLWDKSSVVVPGPTIIPTITTPLLYGPPPTPTSPVRPTPVPVPTMTVAPLYGPPPTITVAPTIVPTMTAVPLYGPPPTDIVVVPKYGVEVPPPTYSEIEPIGCTYEDIYGHGKLEATKEDLVGYEEIASFGDKYDEFAYLKPIEDEYEARPIGDVYEDVYGKFSKGTTVEYIDTFGKDSKGTTIEYIDTFGKDSKEKFVSEFEEVPRDIAIELKN